MTEREFREWQIRGPLWPRRMEAMLAQAALITGRSQGMDLKFEDMDIFRFKPAPHSSEVMPEADTAASALSDMAGGLGVRRLSQGRKR